MGVDGSIIEREGLTLERISPIEKEILRSLVFFQILFVIPYMHVDRILGDPHQFLDLDDGIFQLEDALVIEAFDDDLVLVGRKDRRIR